MTRGHVQSANVVAGAVVKHLAHDFALLRFTDNLDLSETLVLEPVGLAWVLDRGGAYRVSHGHFTNAVYT